MNLSQAEVPCLTELLTQRLGLAKEDCMLNFLRVEASQAGRGRLGEHREDTDAAQRSQVQIPDISLVMQGRRISPSSWARACSNPLCT